MYKDIVRKWGRRDVRPNVATLALLALVFMVALVPLAGCSPQGVAQSATATASAANAQASVVAEPSITPTLPVTLTQVAVPIIATPGVTATGVVTPGGSTGLRPTPTGEPPEPLSQLNIFQFYSAPYNLVSRDVVNLDGTGTDEVLFTVSEVGRTITQEVQSGIAVLNYDSTYREWVPLWSSTPISGTASSLPSINRKEAGGYNGGNLLGNLGSVMALRTTTLDSKAHLYLWRWDAAQKTGVPVKMQVSPGAADTDAVFTADLDINLADINDDGIYELVLDNLKSVQIWQWDGTRFVQGGDR